MPRNIDRIRFRAKTSKPLQVDLVPGRDGGLLEGWTLSGPDARGWYQASSGTRLEFGSLGLLAKLTLSGITEDFLQIPIEFDNSIYTGGKGFSPSVIRMGSLPKMYWTNRGADKIQRASIDGSQIEDLVTSGLESPNGIALDLAAGKMYWTDGGADKIRRANIDGSRVQDLVTSGLGSPTGIALDLAAGKMYWADYSASKIQRANMNGLRVEDLVPGLGNPIGIALDLASGQDILDRRGSREDPACQFGRLAGRRPRYLRAGLSIWHSPRPGCGQDVLGRLQHE